MERFPFYVFFVARNKCRPQACKTSTQSSGLPLLCRSTTLAQIRTLERDLQTNSLKHMNHLFECGARTSWDPFTVHVSPWVRPTPTQPDFGILLLQVNIELQCFFVCFFGEWGVGGSRNILNYVLMPLANARLKHIHNNFHRAETQWVQFTLAQNKWDQYINQTFIVNVHVQDCWLTSLCSTFSVGAWARKQSWHLHFCCH